MSGTRSEAFAATRGPSSVDPVSTQINADRCPPGSDLGACGFLRASFKTDLGGRFE